MDALELLLSRRSAVRLVEPGPSDEALTFMFQSAIRAPDHGRLRPWLFVVIKTEMRERFAEVMAQSHYSRQPSATADAIQRERDKIFRAPLIVVVAARVKIHDRIPKIEQILSAAAAAQNIMLAAHAQGFGAMWKTGDAAYDDKVKKALGLDPSDTIVGFIYLGTTLSAAALPPQLAVKDFVADWGG